MSNLLGKASVRILFLNLRIFSADLFGSLVFLIQEFQVIACQKIIEDICANKVGLRQVNSVKYLRRSVLQDFVGQQQARGLSPHFSGADTALQDHLEICDSKPVSGNMNKS